MPRAYNEQLYISDGLQFLKISFFRLHYILMCAENMGCFQREVVACCFRGLGTFETLEIMAVVNKNHTHPPLRYTRQEQGQDKNRPLIVNKRRVNRNIGEGETNDGRKLLEGRTEELTELLVFQHLLSTAPHLARELAESWFPSLEEVVASWSQRPRQPASSNNLSVSSLCIERDEGFETTLDDQISRRVVLGFLARSLPHLAAEWMKSYQGPSLSEVLHFWSQNRELGVVDKSSKNCKSEPQPTLARKLSLLARLENNVQEGKKKKKRARDKSPYFTPAPTKKWEAPPGYGAKPSWHPPASPFHLVEERLYSDPWRLLVACIFLNKTTAKVAVPVMDKYFSKWGSPEAASAADELELAQLLRPMGLHKKRAQMLIRFSREYLGPWTSPARDLHGIGKYGEDAWRLFCCGDLEVQPTDKELLRYLSWYRCALRTVG